MPGDYTDMLEDGKDRWLQRHRKVRAQWTQDHPPLPTPKPAPIQIAWCHRCVFKGFKCRQCPHNRFHVGGANHAGKTTRP